jgi:hypothetical protein
MLHQNIGPHLHGEIGRIAEVITAGAGNDNVEVNGPAIDLLALANQGKRKFHSCKVMIAWSAALGAAETLTIAANLQTATDSGFSAGLADLTPAFASAIVQSGGAGGTFNGVTEFSVGLEQAKQYVRLQSTANLSRANTDTVAIAAIIVMGGADVEPVG